MKWTLAIAFLVATMSSCAVAADEYLDAARGIGDYLVLSARKDGKGLYWAEFEGGPPSYTDDKRDFPVSLYAGAAGTGFFLLNLHLATGERTYLNTARGIGERLLKTAQEAPGGVIWTATHERKGGRTPDGDGCGLYSGNAGIGLFLARLGNVTKDVRFMKCARAAFDRVLHEAQDESGGCHWTYSFKDIIGGEAGIGLALEEMGRLSGDEKYLKAAQKAARWLLAGATVGDGVCRWQTFDAFDPNFSHGTAGIAFFLGALGTPDGRRAALGAAAWIESVATPSGEEGDGVLWKYYAEPAPKENSIMNSWCHGAPGTVRLFLLLHRLTGDRRWLDVARRAGRGIRRSAGLDAGEPLFANPTWCCGVAGCVDALRDIYEATGDEQFLKDARTLADAMIRDFRTVGPSRVYAMYDAEDESAKKYPYYPTGFMTGNAGIGFALLELSPRGKGGRIDLLPDQPFSVKK